MGAFTAIALLVGGIGIMNVLLASVLERTREIGVRRAVGARRRDVVLQLLAESVAIAIAGSLIGLAAGIGGAFAVTALMRARTEALIYAAVTPGTIVASIAAATITGLVFGVYPALRAARLAPVDAIRAECVNRRRRSSEAEGRGAARRLRRPLTNRPQRRSSVAAAEGLEPTRGVTPGRSRVFHQADLDRQKQRSAYRSPTVCARCGRPEKSMVPVPGFEPGCPCGQSILSRPRMPFRQTGDQSESYPQGSRRRAL